MTVRSPFKPTYGSNQVITVGATNAVSISKDNKSVRIVNSGSALGYFRTGTGAVTASAADVPVAAGACIIIEKPQEHDKIATFCATSTTFQVMTGEGGFI